MNTTPTTPTTPTPTTPTTPTPTALDAAIAAWETLTAFLAVEYGLSPGLVRTMVPHPDGALGNLPVESEAVALLKALRSGKKIKGSQDRAVATSFGILVAVCAESGDVVSDRAAVRSVQGRKALKKAAF